MKLIQYQKLAMRTKNVKFSNKELMLNAILGLVGETTECMFSLVQNDGKHINELGDIMWYLALMCDSCNLDIEKLFLLGNKGMSQINESQAIIAHKNSQLLIRISHTSAGFVADYVKKVYFQGHTVNENKLYDGLAGILSPILSICELEHVSLDTVLQSNVDKLLKRYPEGFSETNSINRKED